MEADFDGAHYKLLTESAPRLILSIGRNVRGSVCAIGQDPEPHGLEISGQRAYHQNCKKN